MNAELPKDHPPLDSVTGHERTDCLESKVSLSEVHGQRLIGGELRSDGGKFRLTLFQSRTN